MLHLLLLRMSIFFICIVCQSIIFGAAHPDIQDLLRNFSVDGSIYTGNPIGEVFGSSGWEKQGLRCALVNNFNRVQFDERWRIRPSFIQRREQQLKSICCRLDAAVTSEHSRPDPDAFSLRCMPSFIVAGTQKSGTTALAAALAQHPEIVFSTRKELHFFDNEVRFAKGLGEGYLRNFPPWEWKAPRWKHGPPIYGEATPSYIAHRTVCPRLYQALGSNVRIILLLREPVARLYSEYQMKARRVQQQNDFLALARHYAAELHACLDPHNRAATAWQHGFHSPSRQQPISWEDIKLCVPHALSSHAHWDKLVLAIDTLNSGGNQWHHVLGTCFLIADIENAKSISENGFAANMLNVTFQPLNCLQKHAKETLKSQREAFFGEINAFKVCAANISDVDTSLPKLDKAMRRCVRVQRGISGQYVYRSTYIAQVFSCMQSVPREQILVLPSERLLAAPTETLARIVRFIGASSSEIAAINTTSEKISEVVNSKFAHFEKSTGWRLAGEYEPIDPEIKAELRAYFAPLNRRLFDYLGETFMEWDSSVA